MAIIRTITSEGAYDSLFIQGKNRNLDIGLKIHLEAHQTLTIKQLVIENTFLPLIKSGDGKLTIGRLQLKDFGGDGINLQGHHLYIQQLIVRNNTATRPYYSLRVAAPTELNIRAALQASKQQVYDWRLLQWLEVQENGQSFFYSPGYHNDIALQAYRPKQTVLARNLLQAGRISVAAEPVLPMHITPDQIQTVANSLFPVTLSTGSQARAPVAPTSVSQLLDWVAATPHSLDLDKNNRIQAIDLMVPLSTPNRPKAASSPAPEDLEGISDVTIRELDIQTNDPNAQLFMLSEQQRYRNFKIGTDKIAISCRYPWWFVANTLENSVLGNANPKQIQLNPGRKDSPKVRIGDGQENSPYCIKASSCSTGEVTLVGLGKTGHAVPATVRIL
ncbi:MAG: hypothetical protein E6Q83_00885 [Thiothrix sp.]|nr:MAG: hypothetical protein E6Q83_00885 [Thiothrix sp.]